MLGWLILAGLVVALGAVVVAFFQWRALVAAVAALPEAERRGSRWPDPPNGRPAVSELQRRVIWYGPPFDDTTITRPARRRRQATLVFLGASLACAVLLIAYGLSAGTGGTEIAVIFVVYALLLWCFRKPDGWQGGG